GRPGELASTVSMTGRQRLPEGGILIPSPPLSAAEQAYGAVVLEKLQAYEPVWEAIDAAPSWAGMGRFSDWASPREVPAKGAPQAAARINGRRRRSMARGRGRGASHQDATALS
ncbi:MAG: hypothetical protein ACKOPT_12315, partial [Cyanobium sp.]